MADTVLPKGPDGTVEEGTSGEVDPSIDELGRAHARKDCFWSSAVSLAMIAVSLVLGLLLRDYGTDELPQDFRFVSGAIGWLYFCAW